MITLGTPASADRRPDARTSLRCFNEFRLNHLTGKTFALRFTFVRGVFYTDYLSTPNNYQGIRHSEMARALRAALLARNDVMSPIGLHHPTETEQRFRFHDPKVWRFMDLTKFIWLLKHRELYFPRIDQLNDPWEGYITKWMYDSLVDRLGKDEAREEIRQLRYDRLFFYVSCWHIGKSESDAMWGLYCGSAEGVAIQTTFRRLVNSFNYKSMAIGPVDYIDFLDASASRFMSKRLPYAHERELRILYGDYDARAAWTRNPTYNYEQLSNSLPLGVSFRCSLSSVIENIWVHPQASSVYFEVVECVVHTLFPRLKSRLRWSEMRGLPEYVETN